MGTPPPPLVIESGCITADQLAMMCSIPPPPRPPLPRKLESCEVYIYIYFFFIYFFFVKFIPTFKTTLLNKKISIYKTLLLRTNNVVIKMKKGIVFLAFCSKKNKLKATEIMQQKRYHGFLFIYLNLIYFLSTHCHTMLYVLK